jgi:hypothetical protein
MYAEIGAVPSLQQEWYTQSVNELDSLLARIEAIDKLIDQIVYMQYGLTKKK